MKTFLRLTVLVLLANLFQLSFAYDFKVGQLYYNINSDGATVSVTGENARPPAYPYESLRGDVVIPSTVTYNGVNYTVTEIGSGAFDGAVGVVNVSVPQTVTRIAGYSFRDCTNLKSINIPTAVTTIDGGTFWGCTALTSFTIPNTVTSI
ncbi:MAG: leucine-rich repeat domain-containing protein [Muribaculaceae bacterium]|nr:leucine-rich repeat domain-containing protein [Muribaculaceae bacterium]